jgi:hypothetical protein
MEKREGNVEDIVAAFDEQKPQLRNGFDGISLVLHFVMRKMGFTFLGCGENNDENANKQVIAPEGWNNSTDSYSFRYRHPKSSMTFIIKNLVMGNKFLIHGLGIEDGNIHSFEININDFINQGIAMDNYSSLFKNLDNLISLFKKNIIDKLFPEYSKGDERPTTQNQTQPPRYDPYNDPLRVPNSGRQPRQPYSPLMEGGPYGYPAPPFGIGGNDLNPFGSPFPVGPSPDGATGNLIGPDHPGFGPFVNDPYGGNPFGGGRGNVGRGSRPPPGARYDPYGPPRGNFGEPDRDDFQPPGGPGYDYYL